MQVIHTVTELRSRLSRERGVVLVPTMGGLHEGHLALMRLARAHGKCVVATIFVNRLQFGPNEDFERYPRTFAADCAQLEKEGVDIVFSPAESEIYPTRQRYYIELPPLADELEGAFRPGFFRGVCTVVLKLFNIVQPVAAVFGKKDRQQLELVQQMVRELNLAIEIVAGETVRAADGLALSSRNNYLNSGERAQAPRLYQALTEVGKALESGAPDYTLIERAAIATLERHGWKVDYIAVRQGSGLELPAAQTRGAPLYLVALGAARLGETRLIDNVDVIVMGGT